MAIINGTSGADTLNGGLFADTINGFGGDDTILADWGDDVILPGGGDGYVDGGSGNDTISFADFDGWVEIQVDHRILGILVEEGSATLSGGTENGTLVVTNVENVIGSNGDDTFFGGFDEKSLDGLGGFDTVDYRLTPVSAEFESVAVDLVAGTADVATLGAVDTLIRIEAVIGTDGADILLGDGLANTLDGDGGNDIVDGRGGDDTLLGGDGIDILAGGDGADTIDGGIGNDTIQGGNGTDTLVFDLTLASGVVVDLSVLVAQDTRNGLDTISGIEAVVGTSQGDVLTGDAFANTLTGLGGADTLQGGAGTDTLDGGAGIDAASYTAAASAVVVSLANLGAQNTVGAGTDTLVSIETLIGSAFGDILTGSTGANRIEGRDGNDVIFAGEGNDTLLGGRGDDVLWGQGGTDTADYAAANPGVTVNLETGTATTGDGTDSLNSIENVIGSAFADTLTGSTGANVLEGRGGNDLLRGGLGNDTLNGGEGTDKASFWLIAGSVTVNLALGTATGAGGTDTLISIEQASGSNTAADTLIGSSGVNLLEGGGGNDYLDGGSGNDTLNGGAGTDRAAFLFATGALFVDLAAGTATGHGIDTLVSIENVTGGAFTDTIYGSTAANNLMGGAGNDVLRGLGGDDTLDGGTGTDWASFFLSAVGVVVSLATDFASGEGTDTLLSIENVSGSDTGGDSLDGDEFANVLNGNGGDDQLQGRGGDDVLNGGAGRDSATYIDATGAVTASLLTRTSSGADGIDSFNSIEELVGSDFDDTLSGDALDNSLDGWFGNDLLSPGLGNDFVVGGTGIDTVSYSTLAGSVTVVLGSIDGTFPSGSVTGAAGTDVLVQIENVIGGSGDDGITGNVAVNVLDGGAGNDTLAGGLGNDTLNGGLGSLDRASYAGASGAVTVDLVLLTATGADGSDTLISIEAATGSAFADTITGSIEANDLDGGEGADSIFGGDGDDTIAGDGGDDLVRGNAGSDDLDGGAGAADRVSYYDTAGVVFVDLAAGTAEEWQGTDFVLSTDTLVGFERVSGTNSFGDDLRGDAVANTLDGFGGNDVIEGRGGIDTLSGGLGADVFVYASSVDALVGAATETITDFVSGTDTLDFTAIDTNAMLSGDQGFAFVGSAGFTVGGGAQIRFSGGLVEADIGGDGIADLRVALLSVVTLLVSDLDL